MNHVSISSLPASAPMSPMRVAPATGESSFKDLLVGSIEQVNTMQQDADQAVEAMFTGENVNPAEVLTAVQKADLAFQLTMQLRNKAMEVYREIRDIQI
jgi:flagellar hook-basal body complex protein FliE